MQKYLLVSAMPTPNGGLHLGHLAAQFLPQDIFKRYHKPRGKIVEFYSGFDVYDNAISVAAKKTTLVRMKWLFTIKTSLRINLVILI
jgi:methionyl-tRNA synthetase